MELVSQSQVPKQIILDKAYPKITLACLLDVSIHVNLIVEVLVHLNDEALIGRVFVNLKSIK
jgi:hypothetical protein